MGGGRNFPPQRGIGLNDTCRSQFKVRKKVNQVFNQRKYTCLFIRNNYKSMMYVPFSPPESDLMDFNENINFEIFLK